MYKFLLSMKFFRFRRINLLSVVCIALAVMVLIIVYSVLEGFQKQLKDSFRRTTPHVVVENVSPWRTFGEYAEVLGKVSGVTGVAERVETVALIGWKNPGRRASTIGSPAGKKGIYVIAVDPEAEDKVTGFQSMLSDFPPELKDLQVEDPADPFRISDELRASRRPRQGIIVGEELAKALRLRRGAEVALMSVRLDQEAGEQGEEGVFRASNEVFYLAGVFRSGMYEQNLFTVYVPLDAGKGMMKRSGYSSAKIAIGTNDFEGAPLIRDGCRKALLDAGFSGERLSTWQDKNRPLLSALIVEKRVLTVLMFFLVLMACGTILAILYMMVLAKRREIGILKALGAPMTGLLQLFLLNGGIIGLLGSIFGVGAALVFLRYINNIESFLSSTVGIKVFSKEVYVFDFLPVVYDVEAITIIGLVTVLFSLLAAFIPAFIAARSDPVRSLRNE